MENLHSLFNYCRICRKHEINVAASQIEGNAQ